MASRYFKTFRPYGHEVALGHVSGETDVYKYGHMEDASATERLIWDGEAAYEGFIDDPSTISLVSTSADDNGVTPGSGAHVVKVFGVGASGMYQSELFLLNGTTAVTSTSTWRRVFRMYVDDGNDYSLVGGANHGLITCTAEDITDTPTLAVISANVGQTLMACFTVPGNCYALLHQVDASTGKSADSIVRFKMRHLDENHQGVWRTRALRSIYQNSFTKNYQVPRFIPGHTDVAMTAEASVSNTPVSGTFELTIYSIGNHDTNNLYQEIEG